MEKGQKKSVEKTLKKKRESIKRKKLLKKTQSFKKMIEGCERGLKETHTLIV